jgi:hypothetical protein
MNTGYGNDPIAGPATQAKTQDRRFQGLGAAQLQPYAPVGHTNQVPGFVQRRHKTPNELSSGMVHTGVASNIISATPIKGGKNVVPLKVKLEPNRIQKYPQNEGSPPPFKNQNANFDIGRHLENNATHNSLMNVGAKRKEPGTLMTVHNDR